MACADTASLLPRVAYNTLLNIYQQKYQVLTRKNLPAHKKPEQVTGYYRTWKGGKPIIDLAEEVPTGGLDGG